MKKIAILGCENSHANMFLTFIKEKEEYKDIEVVGVYSDERNTAQALCEQFGVPVLDDYSDAVGKIDGLVITARHGDNHYKYAKPYIASGIPMFIDKPITVSEEDAVNFMREVRAAGTKITGGSCLKHENVVCALKSEVCNETDGATVGGALRAPIASESPYGGIYFYAQHLVEMVVEIFGRYPTSVIATAKGKTKNVIFRYENYDVIGTFTDDSGAYFATRYTAKNTSGGVCDLFGSDCFLKEWVEFCDILAGGEQRISYEDFISPVFVMNAIERSLKSGKEEAVRSYSL